MLFSPLRNVYGVIFPSIVQDIPHVPLKNTHYAKMFMYNWNSLASMFVRIMWKFIFCVLNFHTRWGLLFIARGKIDLNSDYIINYPEWYTTDIRPKDLYHHWNLVFSFMSRLSYMSKWNMFEGLWHIELNLKTQIKINNIVPQADLCSFD